MYKAIKSNGGVIVCSSLAQKQYFNEKYRGLVWDDEKDKTNKTPSPIPPANSTVETSFEMEPSEVLFEAPIKQRGRPPKQNE